MPIKIGLALSGGGARGLAHIGVLKVLEETQVPVHMLAGTSMGGIIASAYAAGRTAADLDDLANSIRLLDIAQRDRSGMGLLGQGKIVKRLEEVLGGDLTFDQLSLPLALVAVDLGTGEEVILREGSVIEAVLATTAVPIVFPPVTWEGRVLADGGLLNPVPFDVVRHMGADRVVAVHTMHDLGGSPGVPGPTSGSGIEAVLRTLMYRTPWAPVMDVAERSQAIMSRQLVEHRLEQDPPDVMIRVPLKGVGLLDLDQVNRCIQAGEDAARRFVPEFTRLYEASQPNLLARWWRSLVDRGQRPPEGEAEESDV